MAEELGVDHDDVIARLAADDAKRKDKGLPGLFEMGAKPVPPQQEPAPSSPGRNGRTLLLTTDNHMIGGRL